jgi:hypothetical protein
MEDNLTTQTEVTDGSESELTYKSDMPLQVDSDVRLLRLYDEIGLQEDPAMALTLLLSGVHHYGHAMMLSNQVNDRQGKNRVTFTTNQYKLLEYIDDDNVDVVKDTRARDLLIFAIDMYLSDKQELPTKQSEAKLLLNNVKSLYMILMCQGLFDIIVMIKNTPDYVKDTVTNALKMIEQERKDILNEWLEFLKRTESTEVYEIAENLGESIWSNLTSAVGAVFKTVFKPVLDKFNDMNGARMAYIDFRDRFKKVTINFELKKLYERFDVTKSEFQNGRTRVINELNILLQNDQDINALSLLIYGSIE